MSTNKPQFRHILRSGFTLAEILLVITVLGLLIASAAPAYTGYISRGRDTKRISDIDQLQKAHTSFFTDFERYPDHVWGCVNQVAISKYTGNKELKDSLPRTDNICSDQSGYGYASGSLALNPNIYSLVAIMEKPNSWNYSGWLAWFTWVFTISAYNNSQTSIIKGAWPSYIKMP